MATNKNRAEAISCGIKFYHGNICDKHSGLEGLRYVCQHRCVQCARDRSKVAGTATRRAKGMKQRLKLSKEESLIRGKLKALERVVEYNKCPKYRDRQAANSLKWKLANKHKSNNDRVKYLREKSRQKTKASKTPGYIASLLRARLTKALKRVNKGVSATRDLGMSIPDFKLYITKLFTAGMSWENHGEWHIDHIKPLSAFDLTNVDNQKIACHYSNLQPLWAIDNLKKGSKYNDK